MVIRTAENVHIAQRVSWHESWGIDREGRAKKETRAVQNAHQLPPGNHRNGFP